MILAESYMELVTNWPHWAFEFTVEGVTFLLLTMPIRALIRRHDRKKH
jgi:hypothetical protein